jgi:hypothetical protein
MERVYGTLAFDCYNNEKDFPKVKFLSIFLVICFKFEINYFVRYFATLGFLTESNWENRNEKDNFKFCFDIKTKVGVSSLVHEAVGHFGKIENGEVGEVVKNTVLKGFKSWTTSDIYIKAWLPVSDNIADKFYLSFRGTKMNNIPNILYPNNITR